MIRTSRSLRLPALAAALAAALITGLPGSPALAQAVVADTAQTGLAPEQLEKLVDRIALYPDDLVALILPASTNPLQIVQADRYPRQAQDRSEGAARRQVGRFRQVAAQLSRDRRR